jgi:predicted N-formylglutamate amidohydrolase
MNEVFLLLSCEHGGNRVPAAYRSLFRGADALLASHRGWDIGALEVARALGRALDAPLCAATVSRLVVDLNRSRHHPRLFSEQTRSLAAHEQEQIVRRYYTPHREKVEALVAAAAQRGCALHFAIHSFTPKLAGHVRNADIGLLYDPARSRERTLCLALKRELSHDGLRVRLNYPYRGVSDGLTRHLRTVFPSERYLGVEIEINQRHADSRGGSARITRQLVAALRAMVRR